MPSSWRCLHVPTFWVLGLGNYCIYCRAEDDKCPSTIITVATLLSSIHLIPVLLFNQYLLTSTSTNIQPSIELAAETRSWPHHQFQWQLLETWQFTISYWISILHMVCRFVCVTLSVWSAFDSCCLWNYLYYSAHLWGDNYIGWLYCITNLLNMHAVISYFGMWHI